ncbi:MAG TPA: tetratricopeptide repeat protein, partial [Chitinophagales bacterium]|nr:tetratricopeptide repeat protein [Chitinophagales bacterium]
MKILFTLAITGLCLFQAAAQNAKVDSINQLISKATTDTARINLAVKKMQLLSNINLDSAISVGEKTLAAAKKINYYRGIIDVAQNLVGNYCFKGNYKAADENLEFLTQFIQPSKDSADISKVYSNYGMMYGMQSKYDTSIQFYEKAIRIAERNRDSSALKKNYRNIAIGYQQQSNFPPAIAYFHKSLAIAERQNDEVNQAYIYLNMGNTYFNMYDTVRVGPSLLKAVALAKKNDLKNVELYAYTNLSSFYVRRTEWIKAYDYAIKSAELGSAMGDQGIAAASFSKAATALANTKKFKEAEALDQRAISLADSSGQPLNIYQAYGTMGVILKMQEKYKEAI